MQVAKVDATLNLPLVDRFKVFGFPSILMITRSGVFKYEINGMLDGTAAYSVT